ncbi:glyoxal oxidase N-terminus-domain-containing protein [Endogone sp. FLAS-F59071]|nr:glyoxal oxidase N-terminus-domain-containing protein [Endogone sp. FLAS-F59071]|eukprot:RUS19300.1 glyoxal oxidase N-terminus-domain-containing protein [Endogone sp. FLAS-F59071]
MKVCLSALLLCALLPHYATAQTETTSLTTPANGTIISTGLGNTTNPANFPTDTGKWDVIGQSGVPAVHLALVSPTKMQIINRVETTSPYLPGGTGPYTALYDLTNNQATLIPLVHGQPGCSTGGLLPNGTLITTGGKIGGATGAGEWVRAFTYNPALTNQTWNEEFGTFTTYRWYSSSVLMPDGDLLFVGGSLDATIQVASTNPTYEFLIKKTNGTTPTALPFLQNNLPWVLYPSLFVMPDGNVFILANTAAQIWNPNTNTAVKNLPQIPGSPRTYPLTGSTIMLPLTSATGWAPEFMVCGGTQLLKNYSLADPSCCRIRPLDASPAWSCELMPYARLMPDSMVLPDGKILLVNGAQIGFAGYGLTSDIAGVHASNPVYNPVLYDPQAAAGHRFSVLPPSTLARMYHSTTYLLPDGRVMVAGSNSNDPICITQSPSCVYPTLFDIEAFQPPYYLLNSPQPVIAASAGPWVLGYGQTYQFNLSGLSSYSGTTGRLINNGFTTHSSHFDQRAIDLDFSLSVRDASSVYVTFTTPPNSSVVPPSPMYFLYVVSPAGKPSVGWQVSFSLNAPPAPSIIQAAPINNTANPTSTTGSASTSKPSGVNTSSATSSARWSLSLAVLIMFFGSLLM